MTTRSFIKSMLMVGIAPTILTSVAADKFKWKPTSSGLVVLNPEWLDAPYEIIWFSGFGQSYYPQLHVRGNDVKFHTANQHLFKEPYPMRQDENGKSIHPFMLV